MTLAPAVLPEPDVDAEEEHRFTNADRDASHSKAKSFADWSAN
jgi:hypothetical protein